MAGAAVLWAAGVAHAGDKTPKPVVTLKLADLGYPGVSQGFLDSGSSMLSVHFVDSEHLLVTYSLRGLVERIPDDPPDDDDRAVAGVLVELPSGKVLARTRWHLHDHAQYLWPLGRGRFLLRTKSAFTVIAPMKGMETGDAFRQMKFVELQEQQVDWVAVSPDGEVVTLESSKRVKVRAPAERGSGRDG